MKRVPSRRMKKTERPPRRRDPVDGVLLLDKPQGISSNAALQRARNALGAAKAGHTGTLDPMATGLLPLAFGESTKFSQALLDADKGYEATVKLGMTTTTGDAEGEVVASQDVVFSAEQIIAAAMAFVGEMEQLPPMYSALKHAGKPLYAYAREGIDIERKRRRIVIYSLDCEPTAPDVFVMRVRCSKGTYIRTLAEDIGACLGCGAHLTALRRTSIGAFSIENAVSLDAVEAESIESARAMLQPIDCLIGELPCLPLDAAQARQLCHGQTVALEHRVAGSYRVYQSARFLGLGEVDEGGVLSSRRLVVTA